MKLTKRNISILKYLEKHNNALISDISNDLSISERAIRYEVNILNTYLHHHNYGRIKNLGKSNLQLVKISQNFDIDKFIRNNNYILSKSEREEFIIIYILFNPNSFSLNIIAKLLQITINTFKKDLIEAENNLLGHDLLIKKHLNNFYLEYSENNLQKLQQDYLNKYIKYIVYPESIPYFEQLIINNIFYKSVNFKVKECINFLNNLLKTADKSITDNSFFLILSYLIIIIYRTLENSLEITNHSSENLQTNYRYSLESLEKILNIQLQNKEIIQFNNLLLSAQTISSSYYYEDLDFSEKLTKKLINLVSKKLDININTNQILFDCLVNHIHRTLYRIHNNLQVVNPILDQLKSMNLQYFDIIKNTILELSEFKNITEDEIGFIAIYFQTSLKKINLSLNNKHFKVLIICNFGYGTSNLLANNLKEIYDIDIVDIIPNNQLFCYSNLENIDLIISTTKVNNTSNKPVVIINTILNYEDLQKLDNLNIPRNKKILLSDILNLVKEDIKEDKIQNFCNKIITNFPYIMDDIKYNQLSLKQILTPNLIHITDKSFTLTQCINILGTMLLNIESIEKSYIDNMIDVVNTLGNYMVINHNFALFHAQNKANVYKTSLAILISKEPVIIGDKQVNILLALASKDNKEHILFLKNFVRIIKNQKLLYALKTATNVEDVISILANN